MSFGIISFVIVLVIALVNMGIWGISSRSESLSKRFGWFFTTFSADGISFGFFVLYKFRGLSMECKILVGLAIVILVITLIIGVSYISMSKTLDNLEKSKESTDSNDE